MMAIRTSSKWLAAATALCLFLAVFAVTPAMGGADAHAATKKGVVKTDILTVRSDAGTSYKKLGSLAKGKTVTIKGTKKTKKGAKWYKIKFKSKNGYVMAKYVKLKAASKSTLGKIKAYSPAKTGTVKAGPLNVRKNAGTGYKKVGSLKKKAAVTVTGERLAKNKAKWYRIKAGSQSGYVLSNYITLKATASTGSKLDGSSLSTNQFETWMTQQGFPASYKSKLRTLHQAHPEWIFKAQNTGLDWISALSKEMKIGINLVEPTSPSSWKSTASGAYNSKTGTYTTFDGRWNAASKAIVAYYMDPRNFLNETSVYLFLDHNFDEASQSTETIQNIVSRNSCFMNTTSYINKLYKAGTKSKVNPNVITAMVIQEQGWKGGTGLISGTYSGYKGIYNHFNIGAYTANGMTATQRGLWWAKGAGTGATTYGRPWTSIQKSLTGGAKYYASNYVANGQYTYYTKKFNVTNGLDAVATHQYMTNVSGGTSEGKIVWYAYESGSYPITFHIPVFSGMPSSPCAMPQ